MLLMVATLFFVSLVTRGVAAQEFGDIQQLLGFALGNQVNTMMSSCCVIRELRCPVRRNYRLMSYRNVSSDIVRHLERFSNCVCHGHRQCVLSFPASFLPDNANGLVYDVTFVTLSRTTKYVCEYRGTHALVCQQRQSVSTGMMSWMLPGFASRTTTGTGGVGGSPGGGDGGFGFHGLAALGSAGLLGEEMEEAMEQMMESGIPPPHLSPATRRPASAGSCRRCIPLRCAMKVVGQAEQVRRMESVGRFRSLSRTLSASASSSSSAPASARTLSTDRESFHRCLRENRVQPPLVPTTPAPKRTTAYYPPSLPDGPRHVYDRVHTTISPPLPPVTPKPAVTTTRRTTTTPTTSTRKTTPTTATTTTTSATTRKTAPTTATTTAPRKTSTTKKPAVVVTTIKVGRPTTSEKQPTIAPTTVSTRTTPATTAVTTATPVTTTTTVTTTTAPEVITRILVGSGSGSTSTPSQKNAFGGVTETGKGTTSLSGGGLAGVLIGLGFVLIATILIIVFVFRRQRRQREAMKLGIVQAAAAGRHSTRGGLGGKLHYKARPLPSVSSKQAVIDAVDADDDFEKPDDDDDDDSTITNNDSSADDSGGDNGARRYTTPPASRKPILATLTASKLGDDAEGLYATLDETAITSTHAALGGVAGHVTSAGRGCAKKPAPSVGSGASQSSRNDDVAASSSRKPASDSNYVKMDGLVPPGYKTGHSRGTGNSNSNNNSNTASGSGGSSSNGKYYNLKTPGTRPAMVPPSSSAQSSRPGGGNGISDAELALSPESSRNDSASYVNTPSASSVRGYYETPRALSGAETGHVYTSLLKKKKKQQKGAAAMNSRKEEEQEEGDATAPPTSSSAAGEEGEATASACYSYSEPDYLLPCATSQVSRTNSASTTVSAATGNDVYSEPYSASVRRKYGRAPPAGGGEGGANKSDGHGDKGGSSNRGVSAYYSNVGSEGGIARLRKGIAGGGGGGGGGGVHGDVGKGPASSANRSAGGGSGLSGQGGAVGGGGVGNIGRNRVSPQGSNPASNRNTFTTTAAAATAAPGANNTSNVRPPEIDSDGYLVPLPAKPRRL